MYRIGWELHDANTITTMDTWLSAYPHLLSGRMNECVEYKLSIETELVSIGENFSNQPSIMNENSVLKIYGNEKTRNICHYAVWFATYHNGLANCRDSNLMPHENNMPLLRSLHNHNISCIHSLRVNEKILIELHWHSACNAATVTTKLLLTFANNIFAAVYEFYLRTVDQ